MAPDEQTSAETRAADPEIERLEGSLALVRDHIRAGHANDWAIDAIRIALAGGDPRPVESIARA